jgi:hypothetical protein
LLLENKNEFLNNINIWSKKNVHRNWSCSLETEIAGSERSNVGLEGASLT